MPILESFRKNLEIGGMSTHQSIQKYPVNARNLTCLLLHTINIISNVVLISSTKNLMEFTESLFLTITAISVIAIFIHLNWNMRQLFVFFDDLEGTVDRRLENPKSKALYTETGAKVQKMVKNTTFWLLKMTPPCLILPTFLVSFVAYFTTDLDADALKLPLPKWFPFDTKTPIGYTIAAIVEYFFSVNIQLLVMCLMINAIGPSLILISITEDMKCSLHTLNKCAKKKEIQTNLIQQFNAFVQFHAKAKQLVEAFSKIMKFVFATLFAWSIASICCNMFIMQIELQHGASISELLARSNHTIISFALVYICCNFGHKLSEAFEGIDDAIDKLNWYKFPLEICKMLPIVMIGTQEPAELRVFGSISCAREDFKNVLNTGFSYFMVLRQFE